MDKPLITIITVVYNGEATIEDTIKSVISLNYENLEFIIVDGDSHDGTIGIINKYAQYISCLICEKDNGIYDAMNKGWTRAKDDSFIVYLGSGDKILSLPLDMGNYGKNEIVYGKVLLGDKVTFNPRLDYKIKMSNTIHHQGMLVHKSLCSDKPFNITYKVYGDFDFNQRLLKNGARFVFSESLVGYALPGGVTSEFYYRENFSIVLKNFGLLWALASLVFIPLVKFYKMLSK